MKISYLNFKLLGRLDGSAVLNWNSRVTQGTDQMADD